MATYNYTPGGTSDVDKLRLLVPDRPNKDFTPPAVFSDEELDAEMSIWSDLFLAASSCCEQIAMDKAKQALYVQIEAGSAGTGGGRQVITIDKRQVPKYFLDRAKMLKEAAVEAYESIDSVDYLVTHFGEVEGEYVGNEGSTIDSWDRKEF